VPVVWLACVIPVGTVKDAAVAAFREHPEISMAF
jgi:hypothetical protein